MGRRLGYTGTPNYSGTTSLGRKVFLKLVLRSMFAECFVIRELKIYDATVAKTSLKIASSSLSIFFVIISVCLTFKG